ncbi:cytochrome P450 monooxygenase pc-3 [Crucibulum laeve]|uniref:Cytochrome P450 monooxygenase pc-3 n=1 Tax=Crucibulum laeve TaxID=68775 RepID=A0A5C3LPQ8_9AGAR|nr:cytochrome P450 monooxygenase pc-3 [Crucibulum laeve]
MELPPGPVYLARLLPFFLLPTVLIYGSLKVLHDQGIVSFPTWAIVLLCVVSRPVLFVVGRFYKRFQDRRAAAAVGAVIAPHVEGNYPGGLDLMAAMIKSLKTGYPGDVFDEWRIKYGNTYLLRLPLEERVMTFEPEYVKAILATQFDVFEKGPVSFNMLHSLLGTGVFNSDGEMWKFHRTMTRPFFSRERISDFDVFDTHASDALRQAKQRLSEGYPIDFQASSGDVVARFTLDSATQFLFGCDVRSLSAGLAYPESSPLANSPAFFNHPSNVFVKSFMAGQGKATMRARFGPSWPLREFWKDEIKPDRRVVDKFVEPLLEQAITRKKAKALEKTEIVEDEEALNLLDHLVNHTEDRTILKDELLNLLVAGRDTTASTLTFALYMMAEHPHITRRLRAEILGKVGPTNRPTYDDMRDMRFLRAFINEVLRLYPAVPFDGRTSNRPTVWHTKTLGSQPIYIPADTKCLYSVFIMHRRTDLWGPDAHTFDPDRFLDERVHKYLTPNPFIFCPFNAGPRICLGQQFAYHEASFFLVRLLQQFSSFTLAPEAQPEGSIPPASWASIPGSKGTDKIIPTMHLTMYVKGGLWVRMHEAKDAEVGVL